MKLIYIVNVRLPGTWAHSIQIMKTCEAFAAAGLEVELLTGLKRGSDSEIFDFYNIKSKFKIVKIPYFDLSDEGSSGLNFLLRSLSFLLFARLRHKAQKNNILYFRATLAGLFFKNYYLEVHQLPPRLKIWHKLTYKKAKKIIVLTKFLKQALVTAGVSPDKIVIAPDAVDLKEFQIDITKDQARAKLSLPVNKKIIAYCGNFYFHDWKGVDILLNSLSRLNDVFCVLVGGNQDESVETKRRFKTDNLLITGRKTHSEVPLYLKAADALILPNKKGDATSEYYTSPLKLFEYMASGRPIVASDLPSIREVLSEKNSVLVEPNNPDKLAEGISRLLADGALAEKISRQALTDVAEYTWQKRAQKIIG